MSKTRADDVLPWVPISIARESKMSSRIIIAEPEHVILDSFEEEIVGQLTLIKGMNEQVTYRKSS